jgi:hypothetical protein
MGQIISATDLKNEIQVLELEQVYLGMQLKDQVYLVADSFRAGNLLKSTLRELTSTPGLTDSLAGTAMGLVSGIITKKIAIGTSHNLIRKFAGVIVQLVVTKFVAQHADSIKAFGEFILNHKSRRERDTN